MPMEADAALLPVGVVEVSEDVGLSASVVPAVVAAEPEVPVGVTVLWHVGSTTEVTRGDGCMVLTGRWNPG